MTTWPTGQRDLVTSQHVRHDPRIARCACRSSTRRDPPIDSASGAEPKRRRATVDLLERLQTLQNRLWAEQKRSLLLVLQGMDASGKDGTIRTVLSGVNPQGCRVASFKAPAGREAEHDYLWRIHDLCPGHGETGIFNRSHYEDVLAVRVRGLAPKTVWRPRFQHIREFERMLVDEETTMVKVFLHISFDEQRKRLQARIDDPGEAVEVPQRRPRRPRALGQLPGGVRGRDHRDVHDMGSVVRGARRPQMGADRCGVRAPRRRPREHGSQAPARRARHRGDRRAVTPRRRQPTARPSPQSAGRSAESVASYTASGLAAPSTVTSSPRSSNQVTNGPASSS